MLAASRDRPEGWAIALGDRRSLDGCPLAIGADPSSAAFPLAAALITPA